MNQFKKIEKITHAGYWSDFYIYPLFILLFAGICIYSLTFNLVIFFLVIYLFFIGMLAWSFIEYIIHRFVFHKIPYFKVVHDLHHHSPRKIIGTPTYISLPTHFIIVFVPLYLIFGLGLSSILFSGFLAGALYYFFIHHSAHHFHTKKGSILFLYKKYHAIHHRDAVSNFSITLPIWDWIFRTKI